MENYIDKEVSDAPTKEMTKKIVGRIRTRVPKGERYWFINNLFEVMSDYEYGSDVDDIRFDTDNYFHSEESAELKARKLRAVLKGADVIEMPSEEEIENKASEMCCIGGCDHSCEDTHFCGLAFPRERSIKMAEWLKSKIVK